MAFNIKVQRAT